ncbi:hypothetical protein ACOMHN_030151 [Nucella lapillus]
MAQDGCGELSKHETDVLLGLYSGCECLWNTKSPNYKDKKIRIGAIRTIINGMRLETGKDFSNAQIQAALDAVSKRYWQELQQVMEAETSPGNGYKTQWRWFQFLDSFLRENVLHAQTMGIVVDGDKPDTKAPTVEEDGNDTDDYFCATVDSGDDDPQPSVSTTVSKGRGQMQVLPTQTRSSASTSASTRPSRSRTSGRRQDVKAVINGGGSSYSAGLTPATDSHSSRKRRREAAAVSSASTRSMLTAAAAGASGSSGGVSYSRHGGGTHTRSNSTKTSNARQPPSSSSSSGSPNDALKISSQIAETLKAVQILLATSLTDQDQPSMVFARHVANELQQITDYGQRKQCMLDIQQLILRFQTKQQSASATAASVKFEGRDEVSDEEEVMGGGESRGGGGRASATVTQQQTAEDPLLLYFEAP